MTLPNWKAEDYFVDFEPVYYKGPIINAPLVMKTGWIIKYLHEIIFPDAIKAIVNGGELSGLLLGFSIVDYLTGYYVGRRSQQKDFISFMDKYFPEQYKPYSKDIYEHLRSGLVHNLTILNPWTSPNIFFTVDKESELHLHMKGDKLIFSIRHFIEDTRRAEIMYLYDLIMKPDDNRDLVKNFNKRFNKQNGAASTMIETN